VKFGLISAGGKRSVDKEHSSWVLFEVDKDVLKRLEMAKSWGDTILSKVFDSIVDVNATKSDRPIGTTK